MTDTLESLRAEVKRLNAALIMEQNFESRIGTHGPDCYRWGPSHWRCALMHIVGMEAKAATAQAYINVLEKQE